MCCMFTFLLLLFTRGSGRVGVECLVNAGDSLVEIIEIPEFSDRPANKFLY
jgi:hypothetical protein